MKQNRYETELDETEQKIVKGEGVGRQQRHEVKCMMLTILLPLNTAMVSDPTLHTPGLEPSWGVGGVSPFRARFFVHGAPPPALYYIYNIYIYI